MALLKLFLGCASSCNSRVPNSFEGLFASGRGEGFAAQIARRVRADLSFQILIGFRNGSPLTIGHGNGEMYLASDEIALAPFTETIT
ncbi:hypothetical protein ABIB85_008229 [Bradyrhizobium sp. JR1.5]